MYVEETKKPAKLAGFQARTRYLSFTVKPAHAKAHLPSLGGSDCRVNC